MYLSFLKRGVMLSQVTCLELLLTIIHLLNVHGMAIEDFISNNNSDLQDQLHLSNHTECEDVTELCFLCSNNNGGRTVQDAIEYRNLTSCYKGK